MLLLVCLAGGLLAACSNGPSRRDDGAPLAPGGSAAAPTTPAPAPAVVHLMTPTGERSVTVEVVRTPAKIARGLMYREHLPPDHGMLFLMGHESDHAFYMRNTLIPLDMIFITKDLTIAGIVERAEPRTEVLRQVGLPSLYVLEVNAGWTAAHQITPGTKVRFDGVTP